MDHMNKPKSILIVDESSDLPPDLFKTASLGIHLKPNEMWPDGKVRPYQVKLKDGTNVWLTDEEFDRLVMTARHRVNANPIGERKMPKHHIGIGDRILLFSKKPIGPEDKEDIPAVVVACKADGSIRVECEYGLFAGDDIEIVSSKEHEHPDSKTWTANMEVFKFKVTSVSKNGVKLRQVIA